MAFSHHSLRQFRPSLSFVLLAAFILLLWVCGGASRADVAGQIVARAAAWGAIVLIALFARPHVFREGRAPFLFLTAILVLALIQLVPLPPALWQALPGRDLLVIADAQMQPWRPWSISPGGTINAAGALVVPFATLFLMASLPVHERRWIPAVLLSVGGLSLLLGLLQFSGAGVGNPLINDTPGEVGGGFANRNHFALFLAMTCLVAPVWAFSDKGPAQARIPVALGVVILSVLTILATGSRAGLLLGGGALGLGLLIVRHDLQRLSRRRSRWAFIGMSAGVVLLVAALLFVSVAADRAVSVDRLISAEAGHDMRTRGLPTVLAAISTYFPAGSGLGGFDHIFQRHEPLDLLKPTYFNHAHSEVLEVLLDAGVAGGALLAAGVIWWAWASFRAWRHGSPLSRLGSGILALIAVASLFDYPARTPLIAAVATIAAFLLGGRRTHPATSALPGTTQHL